MTTDTQNHKRILVMAAGTGGHVIPGLALAQTLRDAGHSVVWLGAATGMENRLVPPTGIVLHRSGFDGLRGKGVLGWLLGGWQLVRAFFNCLSLIRHQQIDTVLGMGGYVCVPGGLAAALLGKPLVLVNADAQMLLSNKLLLPFADAICFGFDGDAAKTIDKAVVTGNPVRTELAALAVPNQRFAQRLGPLKLLVVGGSSGARALNLALPQALALMPESQRPLVTHQCGLANEAEVLEVYAKTGVTAEVVPFIEDMSQALASCDVIVCRAGAITVAELCVAGVASVLVPLVISTTQHQRSNAQWLAANGAAVHLPQSDMTAQKLADLLLGLSREKLLPMANAARALANTQATHTITQLVLTLAHAVRKERA